jgi:hypothetical protein
LSDKVQLNRILWLSRTFPQIAKLDYQQLSESEKLNIKSLQTDADDAPFDDVALMKISDDWAIEQIEGASLCLEIARMRCTQEKATNINALVLTQLRASQLRLAQANHVPNGL